jgi:hypothetical protein
MSGRVEIAGDGDGAMNELLRFEIGKDVPDGSFFGGSGKLLPRLMK